MNIACIRRATSRTLEVQLGFEVEHVLWPESWAAVWGYVCAMCGVVPPLHDIPALTTDPALHLTSVVAHTSSPVYAQYLLSRQGLRRMASIFDALDVDVITVSLHCEPRTTVEVKQASL